MKAFDDFVEKPKKRKIYLLIFPAVFFLMLIFLLGGIGFYDSIYDNEVFPGVKIGGYNIGGLSRLELVDLIENLNNRYAKEGVDFILDKSSGQKQVKINTVGSGESAVEMIRLDSDALALAALKIGRTGDFWQNLFAPVVYRLYPVSLSVPVIINQVVLEDNLKNSFFAYEDKVQDASIRSINVSRESAEIIPEKSGQIFDYEEAEEKIKLNLTKLSFESIVLKPKPFSPTILEADIRSALPALWPLLQAGPVKLTVNPAASSTLSWEMSEGELATLVEVRRDQENSLSFFLNKGKVDDFLRLKILSSVEVLPKDAIFTTENNKVKDFVPSAVGTTIDMDVTYDALNENFRQRSQWESSQAVNIVLKSVLPKIEISNSNDLGIIEMVGAGSSTFKDSHSNRIKNIANAVKRLNGTLIKPGEIFSSIKYAGPFTLENGFLPEQIIKGRKIEEAVGGGMCQIGTTLFRMAMQTGLPITERHNHSLVVQYYADPVNGNPGTDATLYEPTLDLRFLNDTGHYLLLFTDIDYKKQILTFSLWGTRDGRSGSYSRPLVSKWISAPTAIEYVPLDSKAAAVDSGNIAKCQAAFKGAVASFTYSRITPTGEHIDRVFNSYYRPLPKICPATSTPIASGN